MEAQALTYMSEGKRQNIIQTVKDYGNKLFRFIRNKVHTDEEAEDILQEVWYQFSNVSGTQTIEQVSGWLYAVAKNKITDKYRKQKTALLEDEVYEDEEGELHFKEILLASDDNAETLALKRLFWQQLKEALDEVPENQRQVFILNEMEEMTLQQIADNTGENIKTITSRKGYAVKHLRNRLQFLYNELLND
ncbi:MAG: RNA polymerase sigma factor [Sphingobacteriales bacterium]|nr:RNA polymerase sigma factor [Sphingobacteriales bacterium]MBI3718664.1 RNA polymerase sigma factor [Sphingobacteriales bacterium]